MGPSPGDGKEAAGDSRRAFFSLSLRLGSLVDLLLLVACLPTWLALAARFSWLLELATHFAWQYAQVLPVALLISFARRRRWLAALIAVSLAINLVQLGPFYLPREKAAAEGPERLRVYTLNVLTSNRRFDQVLSHIQAEDPDLVLLLEVDRAWVDAMAPLEERYPSHEHRVRSDNFGVALYTRLPTSAIRYRDFGGEEVPSVVAELEWNEAPLTVIGAHPLPPGSERKARLRNDQLAGIAEFASQHSGPMLLLGDLNTTRFSPWFGDLLTRGGLRDSARGFGYRATWRGKLKWLGVAIDHVLHSPEFAVTDRRVGPKVGSDHRAVVVDLVWAEGR